MKYLIPPFWLDSVAPGQCLRVTCWSPTHGNFFWGFELWDGTFDPNRPPYLQQSAFSDGVTDVDTNFLCPSNNGTSTVGRSVAEPIKKLVLDCGAEIYDPSNLQAISTLPLVSPKKKKK